MSKSKILVIDDDVDICLLMERFLTRNGFEVTTAQSGKRGLEILNDLEPDLVLTDFKLGDINGAELLRKVKEKYPSVPVIIITGYSDIKVAINVMKQGAYDYVTKPLFPDEILMTIKKAMESKPAYEEPAYPGEQARAKTPKIKPSKTGYIFGDSLVSRNLMKQIDLVAPTNFSVIIYGESGAGKEAIAREIHNRSNRKDEPFVAMDCGAMSKELAGSELFGHEKGSFTGALNQKIGHFELANGGTLFLDEVANLSYDIQVSLLRVVQERKVKRIGGTKEIDLDVRILVASNEKLPEACRNGKFREDLYYRFNEFSMEVPSLRDRGEDVMIFAHFFLENTNRELNKNVKGFSDEVVECFLKYPWYGNLRELNNVVKRATLLADSDTIDTRCLPFEITNHSRLMFVDNLSPAPRQEAQPSVQREPEPQVQQPRPNLKEAAKEAEYEMIFEALKKVNFNKTKAAKLLDIDRKTLYNKMKNLNL
jgi:two-component system response regulator HydG